jgi:predicted nucleic acid-binding Zn ribbon protein
MQTMQEIISTVFAELNSPKKAEHRMLFKKWPAIAGPQIAAHTKPSLRRNGQLTIWVDQSALAFELKQRYQQSLLRRTQAILGEETVKSIRFFVGQLR